MSFSKTVNLGNSIIGVSILAMPYCFVQSGILLSILLIVFSGFLTRLSCHLLLKSAFLSKRRSFELLVQDVLGPVGRFFVEVGLIGFLLGTCVAYFIMIGDLAPKILTDIIDVRFSNEWRTITIIAISILVALPLSLLKKVDSLTSLSILSLILYSSLILKLMFETTDKLKTDRFVVDHEMETVSYWNTAGLLTSFPIFSMAMSCQTSLFEIFDNNVANCDLETIRRDNNIIKKAIYMCSFIYITVGLLGYMAFHEQTLYGNILLAFPESFTTTLTKIGFVISLLLSFPLCLFPCRTSVYSLTIGKLRRAPKGFKLVASSEDISSNADTTAEEDTTGYNTKNCDTNYTKSMKQSNNNNNNNNNDYEHSKEWLENNQSDSKSKFHHNIVLPIANKQTYRHNTPSNILKLQTFMTTNGSPYSYTKLIDDDESAIVCDNTNDDYSNHLDNGNGGDNHDFYYENHRSQHHQPTKLHMSDFHFKLLTILLIVATVSLSLLFPNIEFILGIIGSTAGTTVCFVLPAFTFLKLGEHSRTELYLARLLLTIGLAILIFCTYSTLHNASIEHTAPKLDKLPEQIVVKKVP